jgi:hypothetical protein
MILVDAAPSDRRETTDQGASVTPADHRGDRIKDLLPRIRFYESRAGAQERGRRLTDVLSISAAGP